MGRLTAIAIVLALGLGRASALGAPPGGSPHPADPHPPEASPQLAPPIEFLKAGARLFNKGEVEQASKYFDVASVWREHLTEDERVVLDVYKEEVAKYRERLAAKRAPAAARRATADPAVAPASLRPVMPAAPRPETAPADAPAEPARAKDPVAGPRVTPTPSQMRFETPDLKQRARWLLQEARFALRLGRFDEAVRKAEEARGLDVHWGLLDETPAKVLKAIDAARAKAEQGRRNPAVRPLGVRPAELAPPHLLGEPASPMP